MEKAYRYRIYPNKTQQELIQKTFGCVRFVYNYYLNKQMQRFENKEKLLSFYKLSSDLTVLKQNLEWLQEPDKCSLQNTLKDLSSAYDNYFRKIKQSNYVRYSDKKIKHFKEIGKSLTVYDSDGHPKFKKKKDNNKSYKTTCTSNNIKYLYNHIQLPKLGKVKITDKMIPKGRILNATISQEPDGKYYVSLCCTDVEFEQLSKTNNNVGIDLGIVDFAIQSDGIRISNPRFFEQSENKLAKLQRELSRKTIGGSNWNKTRIKVAKLQKHIAEQRRDFLQKLTTEIVKNYDIICIEDLQVSKMKEQKQDTNKLTHTRNKHIGDVSWYEFKRQLEYKCKWYGKELRIIDQYYPSSQICHVCGTNGGKKTTDIREWICKHCNSILDRDLNAAINILNKGLN